MLFEFPGRRTHAAKHISWKPAPRYSPYLIKVSNSVSLGIIILCVSIVYKVNISG